MRRTFAISACIAIIAALLAVGFFGGTAQARPALQATATPEATPAGQATEAASDAASYCTGQGGTVTTRTPAYNTNAPVSAWLHLAGSRDFCTFHAAADSTGFQSQISIALDTLYADEPTLAVLAYLEPVALPPFTGANPSTLYCSKLGGTDIWGGMNNGAGGGWVTEEADSPTNFQVVGMCVFPDMSAIDSWGLTYKANNVVRGTDLSQVVRYKPTDRPDVFFSGTSSNQPAPESVTTKLTEADNGKPVTLSVDQTLSLTLPSNPSTGYSWKITSDDRAVLVPLGEPQFNVSGTPRPGAGGTETFNFKAVAPGTTTLTLVYVRPWETNVTPTPDDTWSAQVTVQ
jgi:inhibitor of cysteine peptidase